MEKFPLLQQSVRIMVTIVSVDENILLNQHLIGI